MNHFIFLIITLASLLYTVPVEGKEEKSCKDYAETRNQIEIALVQERVLLLVEYAKELRSRLDILKADLDLKRYNVAQEGNDTNIELYNREVDLYNNTVDEYKSLNKEYKSLTTKFNNLVINEGATVNDELINCVNDKTHRNGITKQEEIKNVNSVEV